MKKNEKIRTIQSAKGCNLKYAKFNGNLGVDVNIIKKAFGNQVFHGLFHLTSDSCISNDSIKTSTFSDVEIDSNYVLITDDNNTIENIKGEHLLIDHFVGSELLIDYYNIYCVKKNNFDYKDALPSYAGHTI